MKHACVIEGWSKPLRILELHKENNKLRVEKEELSREMDDQVERVKVIFGPKKTIFSGIEKKTGEDLVVENQRLHDQLESTLKEGQDYNCLRTETHVMYNDLLQNNKFLYHNSISKKAH